MKWIRSLVCVASLAALSSLARAGVLTVDDSGGADFTAIQLAVDAAGDGDTILVKPGNYDGFTIDGKALAVVGDVGGMPAIAGSIWLKNLAAGKALTLARLRVRGAQTPASQRIALQVDDCAGAVRVVACGLVGAFGTSFPDSSIGRTGVQTNAASDVAFADCTIAGGEAWWDLSICGPPADDGGSGIVSESSTLAVYDGDVRGGRGGDSDTGDFAGRGGDAIVLVDGASSPFLFASRSFIRGGDGGPTTCLLEDTWGGDGGDGIVMTSASTVHLLEVELLGGTPTVGGGRFGPVIFGTPGSPVVGGTPFQYSVSSLGLSVISIARESTSVTLTFEGDPGDAVYLNDAFATTFLPVPSMRGVQLVPFGSADHPDSARVRRWGIIPASGVLTKTYHVPALSPGVAAQTRYLQAYRLDGTGLTLGGFATLTVLDSAF